MLDEATKGNVRRFLEYSVIGMYRQGATGAGLAPFNNGLRYSQAYSQLEFKMNNFLPEEESRLTGRPYGSIGFAQSNPLEYLIPVDSGSTATVTITSPLLSTGSVTKTYTVVEGDTYLTICGQIASLFAQDGVFAASGFIAINDFGSGPFGQGSNAVQLVVFPVVSFLSPTVGSPFTIAVSGTGDTIPQISQQGLALSPRLTSYQVSPPCPIYGYLPILDYLEDQMVGQVSDNLSVYKGNNATLRLSEMKDREKLFLKWCHRMAVFIGVSQNPDVMDNRPRGGSTWSVA